MVWYGAIGGDIGACKLATETDNPEETVRR